MTSFFHSWFFYFVSLTLFFNSSSFLMMWLSMEINLLSFLFLMSFYLDSAGKYNCMLYYFLLQSIGSMIFLLSSFFKFSNFWLMDLFYIMSLVLKLGIFPLFFWMLNLSGSLQPLMLFVILTFQKVAMMIFLFNSNSYVLEMILISSFIYGSINLFFCDSFSSILVVSSISTCFWLYFFYLSGLSFFLFYFLFYFSLLLSCYFELKSFLVKGVSPIFLFMFLSGLPPLITFFFKFGASIFISINFSMEFLLLITLFTFASLIGYIHYFQKTFFVYNSLYVNSENWFQKMSKISISLMFFFFFLL